MSRSLGTLTLDLIAKVSGFVEGMNQAERASDKARKKFEEDFQKLKDDAKDYAKVVAVTVVGSVAVLAVQTAKAAKEITNLAGISATSAENFQEWAAAAQLVGVEQSTLGKVFQNATKAVGEFTSTASGPMMDFFTKLGPQIGVTAEQFKNLSGPEVLGQMVASMQAAGFTSGQMVANLEKVAGGAGDLLPLLLNNADGFKKVAEFAEKSGAVMSGKLLDSAATFNAVLEVSSIATKGMKNNIAAGLMPVLADLSTQFLDLAADGGVATQIGESLGSGLKTLTAIGVGVVGVFQAIGGHIGAMAAAAVSFAKGDFSDAWNIMKMDVQDVGSTVEKTIKTIQKVWEAGADAGAKNPIIDTIKDLQKATKEAAKDLQKATKEAAEGNGALVVPTGLPTPEQLKANVDAIAASFLSVQDQTKAHYDAQAETIQAAIDAKVLAEQEGQALLTANNQAYLDANAKLEKQANQAKISGVQSALGAISTLMNGESRKLFEVGKVAAIANATIDMYSGVMKAWALGPLLGPPLAALVAVAGAANIKAIASTKFGGGSAGVSNTQAISNSAAPAQTMQQQAPTHTTYLRGIDPSKLYSGEDLLSVINGALKDGGQLIGAAT